MFSVKAAIVFSWLIVTMTIVTVAMACVETYYAVKNAASWLKSL